MSSWKQDDYVDASEAWRRPNDDYVDALGSWRKPGDVWGVM